MCDFVQNDVRKQGECEKILDPQTGIQQEKYVSQVTAGQPDCRKSERQPDRTATKSMSKDHKQGSQAR